jgi:thiazole synthase ThiGH ThiG subunit
MARAFKLAVEAGRSAYAARLMQEQPAAEPTSPLVGVVGRL